MRFMNDFDIERALSRYASSSRTPNRLAAAQVLDRLARWTDANSDGWAYWPKPARSAAKVMDLLEGNGTNAAYDERARTDATATELSKALAPVKAFLTRQNVPQVDRDFILRG